MAPPPFEADSDSDSNSHSHYPVCTLTQRLFTKTPLSLIYLQTRTLVSCPIYIQALVPYPSHPVSLRGFRTVVSMVSPPSAPSSLLLYLRTPPCSRRALLFRQRLHPSPLPRTGRRPLAAAVVEQLAPRPPGTGRRSFEFACGFSRDPRNEPPAPQPDKVSASISVMMSTLVKSVSFLVRDLL